MQQIGRLLHSFCTSLLLSHNLSDGSLPEDYAALHCETPAELETELRTVVRETLLRVGRTPDNIDSIIYEVKQYIDENYSMNLSLDLLAAQVHLSPSYFSKLFKREMGENFSTYILNTRIEQAKLLLQTTDKKAYEIAEAVGIYDPCIFPKSSKKLPVSSQKSTAARRMGTFRSKKRETVMLSHVFIHSWGIKRMRCRYFRLRFCHGKGLRPWWRGDNLPR